MGQRNFFFFAGGRGGGGGGGVGGGGGGGGGEGSVIAGLIDNVIAGLNLLPNKDYSANFPGEKKVQ